LAALADFIFGWRFNFDDDLMTRKGARADNVSMMMWILREKS
jgi:hypothetical protein